MEKRRMVLLLCSSPKQSHLRLMTAGVDWIEPCPVLVFHSPCRCGSTMGAPRSAAF